MLFLYPTELELLYDGAMHADAPGNGQVRDTEAGDVLAEFPFQLCVMVCFHSTLHTT